MVAALPTPRWPPAGYLGGQNDGGYQWLPMELEAFPIAESTQNPPPKKKTCYINLYCTVLVITYFLLAHHVSKKREHEEWMDIRVSRPSKVTLMGSLAVWMPLTKSKVTSAAKTPGDFSPRNLQSADGSHKHKMAQIQKFKLMCNT